MSDQVIEVALRDVSDDGKPLKVTIKANQNGVTISFDGYGDAVSMPGDGEPLLIENRSGTPYVLVWGSINQEDPTSVLSLCGAAESRRMVAAE